MKKPRLPLWFKRVLPVLLLVGALATQRQALASSLVRYSSFEEIAPGTQFDERPEYGEEAYAKLNARAELEGLSTARRFFDEDGVAHYVQARHDVGQRKARLKGVVDALLSGAPIDSVWN